MFWLAESTRYATVDCPFKDVQSKLSAVGTPCASGLVSGTVNGQDGAPAGPLIVSVSGAFPRFTMVTGLGINALVSDVMTSVVTCSEGRDVPPAAANPAHSGMLGLEAQNSAHLPMSRAEFPGKPILTPPASLELSR